MIIVDSREKQKAIRGILEYFDEHGVSYYSSKLIVGDYVDFKKPDVFVDRKQNIAELAKNCTTEHGRFRKELQRTLELDARLVILVEQNRYRDRDEWIRVESVEDLMLWSSPHTTIRGEQIYRILRSWMAKYPVTVQFCDKRQTGKRILEILGHGSE